MYCNKLFSLLILFTVAPAFAENITNCGTLSTAGATYVLQNNVTANGTCFTVTANNVVLDLNGHTVTYDNAVPISVSNGSFESALSGSWDVAGAANATRAAGEYLTPSIYVGSYAIKVTTPTADQQVQSIGMVTLQPNTKYSLSGMVYNQVADAVQMSIGFDGTAIMATQTARTYRGFQYIYTQFTTGDSEVSYKINLSVTGASGIASGSVYFDDIRVQQSAHYGVDAGAGGWARNPTIKNGTITQGQAHGDWSHAIKMSGLVPSDVPGGEISGLTLNVSGNSSKAIESTYFSNFKIFGNTINSNVDTIAVRDHYDGALIYASNASAGGLIYNNTITSGIQTGIFVKSSSPTSRMQIYSNDITLQSKYTNDFAIASYGNYGDTIYGNTIRCTGSNNSCRGIYLGGSGGAIYNNTIDVQYRANNQEYTQFGGCAAGAFGIQLDCPSASCGAEIYGNTVTAIADACNAMAFRFTPPSGASSPPENIHDNTFSGLVATGRNTIAETVAMEEGYANHMIFTGNTLITNCNFLYTWGAQVTASDRSLTMDGNTFRLSYPKATFYHPLASYAVAGGSVSARNVSLINNTYNDATVEVDMEGVQFAASYLGYAPDPDVYNIVISGNLQDKVYKYLMLKADGKIFRAEQ